jgi:hypothetical protein
MTFSDWIALASLLVASAVGAGTIWFTHQQWNKVKAKVAMIRDSGKASEVLPAWYTERMMRDHWLFALLTNDGRTVVIKQITAISDDGKWMDVELAEADEISGLKVFGEQVVCAVAADRTKASLQIAHIVAAFDLSTS